MADYLLAEGQTAYGDAGLLKYGFLKSPKLVDGKDNEEGFKQHDRLSQASIQIVVVRVHLVPELLGVDRDTLREVIGCRAEIFAQVFDHFLQRVDLM